MDKNSPSPSSEPIKYKQEGD
jgi:peptidoglycan-N-acetylglucosamine deacetylase